MQSLQFIDAFFNALGLVMYGLKGLLLDTCYDWRGR